MMVGLLLGKEAEGKAGREMHSLESRLHVISFHRSLLCGPPWPLWPAAQRLECRLCCWAAIAQRHLHWIEPQRRPPHSLSHTSMEGSAVSAPWCFVSPDTENHHSGSLGSLQNHLPDAFESAHWNSVSEGTGPAGGASMTPGLLPPLPVLLAPRWSGFYIE